MEMMAMRGVLDLFKKPVTPNDYRIPEGERVYAIGDIHGRADLLGQLLDQIVADAAGSDTKSTLVYLGDYIDRGAEVKETIELLLHGPSEFRSIHLMGNHEALFLSFLENPVLLDLWMNLGGRSTLLNYGVKTPISGVSADQAKEISQALIAAMPDKHLSFIKNLEKSARIGDVLFVHAGINPRRPLDEQHENDLLWIRNDFTDSGKDHGVKVVHGHTICREPQERANRIGVDTGAYATGNLSCVVLEDNRSRYLSTRK
jgi:serine/threonine protein phosphatase 1